jgi:hypothetical protein
MIIVQELHLWIITKFFIEKYQNRRPRTHSERLECVKNHASKVASGLDMIGTFFENPKRNVRNDWQVQENSMNVTI